MSRRTFSGAVRRLAARAACCLAIGALAGCASTGPADPVLPSGQPDVVRMDDTIGTYGAGREDRLILVLVDAELHEALAGADGAAESPDMPAPYARYLENLRERHGVRRVADWPLSNLGVRCLVFEVDRAEAREAAMASLRGEPDIESVQPMQLFASAAGAGGDGGGPSDGGGAASADVVHDDPLRPLQGALAEMQVDLSHRWADGEGVTVGVIDTGVESTHPDLDGHVLEGRNFVDDDAARFAEDVHGTAVAGVIAASAGNRRGMVGVAPEASVLPLKACWQGAEGEGASCNSFTLAKAINVAIGSEVDIINLSLTGPPDPLLAQLVEVALERDTIVVGAWSANGARAFPADVPGTVTVDATADPAEATAAGDRSGTGASVTAPGRGVLSARPTGDYGYFSGSSFATAYVAGLAALVRQSDPSIDGAAFAELVASTADPATGRVNACRAVARVNGESPDACPAASAS